MWRLEVTPERASYIAWFRTEAVTREHLSALPSAPSQRDGRCVEQHRSPSTVLPPAAAGTLRPGIAGVRVPPSNDHGLHNHECTPHHIFT